MTDTTSTPKPVSPARPLSGTGAFVPGTLLAGRYRIVARVGRGGMGEVYRADDLKLGQPVALKFLPPELERDAVARERLLGEVRLARTISHPNVCRVYDLGEVPAAESTPARAFLTMEYIDGEDLASLLRRIGRLPAAKALEVARQLCAGLAAAHDKGVLHRDLKPANIMIDGRGQARIADFGIAVEATPDADATDGAGTLAYMAPERFAGKPATVQSDLYALGLILYETYTGKPAFAAATQGEWRRAHTDSAPSSPSAIVADIEPAVERAILRCLAKEPAKRPASAAQVAAALPGGDPLAAAIAAGETPSPELVAASGEEGTLPRWQAWAWLATALVALAIAVPLLSSVLLINHVFLPLEPRQLERQARQTLHALGYTAPPADAVSEWRRSRADGLVFVYLESPAPLVQAAGQDFFTLGRTYQDDAMVHLDPEGRLRRLDIGGNRDYSDAGTAKDPDWTPLLKATGASAPPVASALRRWPPGFYADTRAAWTAVIDGAPQDIEAGALRGRPVSLRMRPIGAKDEPSVPASLPALRRASGAAINVTFLGIPAVLAFFARRNTRLGRGDRRGAMCLTVFCVVCLSISTAFQRHWSADPSLLPADLVATLLFPLSVAILAWVSYVGVEPYVRRRWPALLIGWTRLLDGRLGDGLVGQALLAGVAGGTLLAGLNAAFNAISRAADVSGVRYLYYTRWNQPTDVFDTAGISCLSGLVCVGVLVVGRRLFRRDWAGWLAVVIVMTPFSFGASLPPAVAVVEAALEGLVLVAVLYRFGLLALTIAISVNFALIDAPLTLDASRWYFWQGAFVVALVLGLALWGFRNVLGKQTLLPAGALEE
jgi:Protein kinase domain